MLDKIAKDKNMLDLCMKYASKHSPTQKISDIFETFVKLSQSGSLLSGMFENVDANIKYILSEPGDYENKKERLKEVLKKNESLYNYYVMEKAANDGIKDKAFEFLATSFIDYMLNVQLPKYNSKEKMFSFSMEKTLDGLLNRAHMFNTFEEAKKNKTTVNVDDTLENQKGNVLKKKLVAPDQNYEPPIDNSPEERLSILESILRENNSPYLGVFLQHYKRQLNNIIEQINRTRSPQERERYGLMFDKIFEDFSNKTQSKYNLVKPNSSDSIKNLDETFSSLRPTDDLIKNILMATNGNRRFYKLPLIFSKYEKEHPEFSHLLLKTGLESEMYIRLKKALQIAVSQMTERKQGGSGNLGVLDLWHSSLLKAIDETVKDPDLKEKFKRLALDQIHPERGQNASSYKDLKHFGPLVQAGKIKELHNQLQEDFPNLSEEEIEKYVEKIMSEIHPVINGNHVPLFKHVMPNPKNLSDRMEINLEGEHPSRAREMVKQELKSRFKNAQDIISGRLPEKSLLHPRHEDISDSVDSMNKESEIEYLIKKYAFKH